MSLKPDDNFTSWTSLTFTLCTISTSSFSHPLSLATFAYYSIRIQMVEAIGTPPQLRYPRAYAKTPPR
ncbi:hypothetical protein EJ06DRAFT_220320 [Trichodelitschia bisporula]|uniref:Uncharacterized protein n=1 Tax=Trichodelitschia bisporula TaxID=703511 RepID=A0A6G1I9M4_9PEZI|nr:hypothetical protein EJ06DRAFT_220320 [Trichodelitschia bisporula]